MNDGNTADVVYLDFAKAFDSVNHRFLLAKFESFGLCEKVVRWVRSYLTEETRIKSAIPTPNSLPFIIVLTFCIVVIEVL